MPGMSPLRRYGSSHHAIDMPNLLSRPQEQDRNRGTSILNFKDGIRELSERRLKQLPTGVHTLPAGLLSSIGADCSFEPTHAMAYTHPAAFQIRRVATPRKNACWGGTPASACCAANTDVQTL
jgi:hypothetical protein